MKTTFLFPLFLLAVLCVPRAGQNQTMSRRASGSRDACHNVSTGLGMPQSMAYSQSLRVVASAGRPDPREASNTARERSGSGALTEEYRVGIGDVLDIRLENIPTHESTLFTVITGGFID